MCKDIQQHGSLLTDIYRLKILSYPTIQEDHDGPVSLTCVLSSKGQQSYVPTCDPRGGASFDPRGIK